MKRFYFKTLLATLLLLCSTMVTAQTLRDWTSTNTAHGSTSSYTYSLNSDCKKITFDWSVSSESGYDWLIVTIDGTEVLKKSGIASGTYTQKFTSNSYHTLIVKYTKDGSASNGNDQAKIYNIKYSVGGVCGTNATWMIEDSTLTIEGTGAMNNYKSIFHEDEGDDYYMTWYTSSAPWYNYNINRVIISKGITTIGDYAFYKCTNLTSVTIPNSVTTIGSNAFYNCSRLTSVTIPNSVTTIGSYAFSYCSELTSVTIGNSVTTIEYCAFYNCSGLTSVTIPNSVTTIEYCAFYNCSGLTSVTIPNSVTSIGNGTFWDCSGLTSVTIPNSVTSIGDNAFYNCNSLKTIYNNSSLNITKGSSNHGYVAYYANVVITPTSDIQGNFVFNTTDGTHTLTAYTGNDSIITLPEDYNGENYSIGDYLFKNHTELTSVTIPNSVTTIGQSAFSGCSGLTSVTIPNSVTSIGDYAFSGCSGLTNVTIPNSVTSIGDYAFNGCSGLTSVTIPNSVTTIGSYAFSYCSGLTSVTIPNSVTTIGSYAFSYCSGLTSVTIPNSVTTIGSYAFQYCNSLKTIYNNSSLNITKGSSNHGYVAYYANAVITPTSDIQGNFVFNTTDGTHTLTGYTGNDSIIALPEDYNGENYSIGNYVFQNRTELTSVTIPNSVTTIGNNAFYYCTNLRSVTIGNSVTTIGSDAFYKCRSLKIVYNNSSLNITKGSYNHGYVAYYANSIVTPDDDIQGEFIFRTTDGTNILIAYDGNDTIITLPENYNGENYSIGDYLFKNHTELTSVTIPESVEEIAANAFSGCTNIAEIYSMAEVPAVIAETSFPNYSATLYVPAGAKRLYKITTVWSNFTNIKEMEPTEEPEVERLEGDVNGDGVVNIADITRVVEIILYGAK